MFSSPRDALMCSASRVSMEFKDSVKRKNGGNPDRTVLTVIDRY
jgi:hypothetical protein